MPSTEPEAMRAIDVDPVGSNLATLNEVVAELVAKVSGDPEFVTMTRDLLKQHSHHLGYDFQGEPAPHDMARRAAFRRSRI